MPSRRFGGSSPIKEQRYKTHRTTEYQNTLRRLEKIYNKLFKASLKAEKAEKARSSFFHKKFPSVESYINTIKIKPVIGEKE